MILLFVLEKALPALPFSMMFGVGFYFLAQVYPMYLSVACSHRALMRPFRVLITHFLLQFIMDPYFANATMQTLYV